MKILHVTTHFNPFVGGLENLVLQLAIQQAKEHEVSILTLKYDQTLPNYELISGVKIFRVPCFVLLKNQYAWPKFGFSKEIQKINPDVLFTHTRFFATSFFAGRTIKNTLPKSLWIHTEHGMSHVPAQNIFIKFSAWCIDQTLGRWIFKKAQKIVVLSHEGKIFIEKLGALPSKIVIIHNGVKLPKTITPIPQKNKILFFGRMIREKGILEVLEVAKKCGNWTFELCGSGNLDFSQLPKNVIFSGEISPDKISEKIQKADLILLPSYAEGSCLAVLESAAQGRAILATPVGQNKQILSPDFIVPIKNTEKIIEKLCILENNWKTLEQEGQKNQKQIKKDFNFESMIQAYKKTLSS